MSERKPDHEAGGHATKGDGDAKDRNWVAAAFKGPAGAGSVDREDLSGFHADPPPSLRPFMAFARWFFTAPLFRSGASIHIAAYALCLLVLALAMVWEVPVLSGPIVSSFVQTIFGWMGMSSNCMAWPGLCDGWFSRFQHLDAAMEYPDRVGLVYAGIVISTVGLVPVVLTTGTLAMVLVTQKLRLRYALDMSGHGANWWRELPKISYKKWDATGDAYYPWLFLRLLPVCCAVWLWNVPGLTWLEDTPDLHLAAATEGLQDHFPAVFALFTCWWFANFFLSFLLILRGVDFYRNVDPDIRWRDAPEGAAPRGKAYWKRGDR